MSDFPVERWLSQVADALLAGMPVAVGQKIETEDFGEYRVAAIVQDGICLDTLEQEDEA